MADGVNQFTDEHARLLRLIREPLAIAMSNAMEHQEVIRFKQMLADDNRYLLTNCARFREMKSLVRTSA